MIDLTTIMLWILFLLGIFTTGHIIGYRRGKRFYEKQFGEYLMLDVSWWKGWGKDE